MSKKSSIETKKTILIVLISLCIVGLVVVGLLFLLGGKTTTSGEKVSNEKSVSLVYTSTSAKHPKLTNTNNPSSEEIKATLVFNGDKIDTAGLIYTLYYPEANGASGAESMLHAELNIGLGDAGLGTDAFSNKFNVYEDKLIVNLFADGDEINAKTAPYFLINASEDQLTNWTIEDYKNNYINQGFSCEQS